MFTIRILCRLALIFAAPIIWLAYSWGCLSIALILIGTVCALSVYDKYKAMQAEDSKDDKSPKSPLLIPSLMTGGLLALLCLGSLVFNSLDIVLYYPVAVNAILLGAFTLSLFTDCTACEYFARLTETKITESVKRYTRKVTVAWVIFFICNGSIALFTVYLNELKIWALWNGLLSYVFIGLMAAGEYLIRLGVRRRDHSL